MSQGFIRFAACCLMLHASSVDVAWAQSEPTPAPAPAEAAQSFSTEQIDALVAPIALYPDPLLTQILMASTFPLQVVAATRWVEEPAHKGLSGDALTKALEPENWDPSVKSLVPFPEVLAKMNADLDWMQQLGYAFAEQQADVLNSVQRLRRQAQSNGSLQSTPQQVVRTEQQEIVIEPAQPNVIYVPSYNPTTVYGAWPYPSYPPVYLPPAPAYPVGTALATGLAFGAGLAITAGLWNWASPAWGRGEVNVNVNRYNNINANRARTTSNVWQPNRTSMRTAGLSRPPAGPVGRPAGRSGLPASAVGRSQVSVPRNAVAPPTRPSGTAGTRQPAARQPASRPTPQREAMNRAGAGQTGNRPNVQNRQGQQPTANRPRQQPAANRPQQAPNAFSSMNEGRRASQFSQRGSQSRSFSQAQRPAGGGGARGGGGRFAGRR